MKLFGLGGCLGVGTRSYTMAYNLTAEMFAEWAIGMIVVAIRFYARWKVGKGQFHWDDAFLGLVVVRLPTTHPTKHSDSNKIRYSGP